ncbi:M20 family metallopeptidase [Pokkaliibacter sp. MBI-7]|uniref:M20 aminoacylase family protein n=1 Tax=Pokkaliibacter sp. MBI-7 TaxID=3040600 RepID=UPI00244CDC5D|nr:M20 family metallopeptidase [Pokkaliibacter sp. MBI-7]MDH2431510.1 M20 family metallopeptidase [Pokkaliibacter sp. MBI-7]
MTRLINDPAFLRQCEDFVSIRQDIHSYPELGADVPRTSQLVADLLKEWGYEVHTGIGGLGVVGVLRQGNGSKRLGIRADMDALPILEKTDVPYRSKCDGHMHACGHDGHTAILLAAAHYLARHRGFDGTLNLIFQPDEEGLSGAKAMIEDGLFSRFPCDAVYALHNMPGIAEGVAAVQTGIMTSSSDRVTITFRGKGGHGALPHRAIDPTVAMAATIMALQTVVSRNLSPMESGVVSIGTVRAGTTSNVIPETAEMVLSVRAMAVDTRQTLERRIRAIVEGQAAAFGIEADIRYDHMVPAMLNTEEETAILRQAVAAALGEERLAREHLPAYGSEDFAWMIEEVPGSYFMLGNGLEGAVGCSVHNPHYDFNDQLVPAGAACWIELARTFLV